jgi:hypothetical protein
MIKKVYISSTIKRCDIPIMYSAEIQLFVSWSYKRYFRYAAAKKLCENFPGATIYLTTKSEKITPQVRKEMKVVFERDEIEYFLVYILHFMVIC